MDGDTRPLRGCCEFTSPLCVTCRATLIVIVPDITMGVPGSAQGYRSAGFGFDADAVRDVGCFSSRSMELPRWILRRRRVLP